MDIVSRRACRIFFIAPMLFITTSGLSLPALADVYQCTRHDGSVLFTNGPCQQGMGEPVVLLENSALDSTAERNNIAAYQRQQARRKKNAQAAPQVLFIRDVATEERNARVNAREHGADKRRKKTGKKKAGAKKTAGKKTGNRTMASQKAGKQGGSASGSARQ